MHSEKILNLDMDGTFVDFYGVPGWLEHLTNFSATPYEIAKPLFSMSRFAKLLNSLKKKGYILNIISWTSKTGTPEFDKEVEKAKKKWLKKHLPSVEFDNIYIVPYGTPKHTLASGILFDDEEKNRKEWGKNAYDVDDILGVLKAIA